MADSKDRTALIKVLSEALRSNRERKRQLGEFNRRRWGAATRIIGDDPACYVGIFQPGLAGWRRWWASRSLQGNRWAAVPFLPEALTGGEVLSLIVWITIGIVVLLLTDLPSFGATAVLFLLFIGAYPVAVFIPQRLRRVADDWMHTIYDWDGSTVAALVEAVGAWPLDRELPRAFHARLWEVGQYTTGHDPNVSAVIPELLTVLEIAKSDEVELPAGPSPSLEELRVRESARHTRSYEDALHRIMQTVLSVRGSGEPGDGIVYMRAAAGAVDRIRALAEQALQDAGED